MIKIKYTVVVHNKLLFEFIYHGTILPKNTITQSAHYKGGASDGETINYNV